MRTLNRVAPLMAVMFFASIVLILPSAIAQTDWAVEGGTPLFGQFNSPPAMCLPPPMPYSLFPSPIPSPGCPMINPFPFTIDLGGTDVDNDGNFLSGGPAFPAVFNSDGKTIEMVDAATGAYIISWTVGGVLLPGAINGLGYDSTGDIMWVSDGSSFVGLGLSPSCTIPPPIVAGPFPLPLVSGVVATGLDYDPCTGTLWYCDAAGTVANFTTAGVLISFFSASPPLSSLLTGLTVNTATIPNPAGPNIQVTDGILVAEFTPAGTLATPGPFYLTTNPYPIPPYGSQPVSGLGFSLKPTIYGKGCPAGSPPTIGWSGGYPFVGNSGFAITLTGATPGTFSYLVIHVLPVCPPLNLPGCPGSMWVMFPWLYQFPLGIVPASGSITFPLGIPGGPPCGPYVGIPIFCQFVDVLPGPIVKEVTKALQFTIGDA